MIQLKQEELLKSRSYAATLRTAYKVYAVNFRAIIGHIWPYWLAMSVVAGWFIWQAMSLSADHFSMAKLLWFIISGAVTAVAYVVFYGRTFMLFNPESQKWNTVRALKLLLWTFLLALVVMIVTVAAAVGGVFLLQEPAAITPPAAEAAAVSPAFPIMKIFGVTMVTILILSLALLPFLYVGMRYVADTSSRMHKMLWKGYLRGLRHWAYLFLTFLVAGIFIALSELFVTMPLGILSYCNQLSALGQAMGDPSGLPGHFGLLVFVTAAATYLLLVLINIFFLFVAYYAYGSVEAKEQEYKASTL
ncbi:MAG: hypothetical protein IJ928_11670 [Prevotella sp.]|nr:hypothetical protein [Prevotella sp.]